MQRFVRQLGSLSRPRQFALAGAAVNAIAVFMPWHSVGLTVTATRQTFNAFGDINFPVGVLVFGFAVLALAALLLPVLGIRLPRLAWAESQQLQLLGGLSLLLILVLYIQHSTSIRTLPDMGVGIHLALAGSLALFFAGYVLSHRLMPEPLAAADSEPDPFRLPRQQGFRPQHVEPVAASHPAHSHQHAESAAEVSKEDLRMKLDL